jgi:glycosyltransferase involved in cell wall biosynthesis
MSTDKVTVVIPCFNSGATLIQAVNSVKAQTWNFVEIIIVDDGSTDQNTISTLESLKDVILIRQQNKGLPAARNTGFQAAAEGFILPLDSDDWLEPIAIESLMCGLRDNQAAAFAYSYIELEGDALGVLPKSYNYFEQLFLNQIPYCLLLPYSTWRQVGGYDESMLNGYEDWDFNIRLGAIGLHGHVVRRALFHYRVSSGGMLISKSNRLHSQLWRYIQMKHPLLYKPTYLAKLWREWSLYPSTYPLTAYFLWLLMHRVLPDSFFSALFRLLRTRSHSRRLTAKKRIL